MTKKIAAIIKNGMPAFYNTLVLSLALTAILTGVSWAQWQQIGPPELKVQVLERSGVSLLLGTESGIYELDLNSLVLNPVPVGLESLDVMSVLALNSDTILAGVTEGSYSIFRRVPGTGWLPFQNDYGGGEFHPMFDITELSDSSLIATGIAVIAKSTDRGESWRPVWSDWYWLAMGVVFVEPDINFPGTIWAGGEAAIFSPWLLKSTDFGETWNLQSVYFGGDNRCHDIALHPTDQNVAWVSMEGRVRKTSDGGATWDDVLVNDYYLYAIEIDPTKPSHLYCTGAKFDAQLTLFISYDGGQNWQQNIETSYPINFAYDMYLYEYSGGNQLFLATNHGVFVYSDDFASCCEGNIGDSNNDGEDANILDLTFLIDFIFRGGIVATCPAEADLNGDGDPSNILDLTFLVNFIFRGGPAPGACE